MALRLTIYKKMDVNPNTLRSIQALSPDVLSYYVRNFEKSISSRDILAMMESLDAFVLAVTTLCSVSSPNSIELSYWYKSVSLAMDYTLALSYTPSSTKETREILYLYKLVNTILKQLNGSILQKIRRAPRELHVFSETEIKRLNDFRVIARFLVEQEHHWDLLRSLDRDANKIEGKIIRGDMLTSVESKSLERSEEEHQSQKALKDDVRIRQQELEKDFVYNSTSGTWQLKMSYKTVTTMTRDRMGQPRRRQRHVYLENIDAPDHLVYYDNEDYMKLIDFIRSRVPLDATVLYIKLRKELLLFRVQFAQLALQNAVHIPSVVEEYDSPSIVSLALDLSHEWKLHVHSMHRATHKTETTRRTRFVYGDEDQEDESEDDEDEGEDDDEDEGEDEGEDEAKEKDKDNGDQSEEDDYKDEKETKLPFVDPVIELRVIANIENQGHIAYNDYIHILENPSDYTATEDYAIRNKLVANIVKCVNMHGVYTPNIRRCIKKTIHYSIVKILNVDGDGDLVKTTVMDMISQIESMVVCQTSVKRTIEWVHRIRGNRNKQREKTEKAQDNFSTLYADELDLAFAEFGNDILDVFYTRLAEFKSGHVDSERVQSDVAGWAVAHITQHIQFFDIDVQTYLVDQLGVLMFSHLVFPTDPVKRAIVQDHVRTSEDTTELFRVVYDLSSHWVYHEIVKKIPKGLFANDFKPIAPDTGINAARPSFQGVPLVHDDTEDKRLRQQQRMGLLVDTDEEHTDTDEEEDEQPRPFRRLKKNPKNIVY
jgi:hypothetical protein